MEFKVRAIDAPEEKSKQEVENELLKRHEAEQAAKNKENEKPQEEVKEKGVQEVIPELTDEQVLSYIEKRYNKQIKSVDELLTEREKSEPLPPEVDAYFKYKKETGRGIEDFVKLNKDFNSMPADDLLREYYLATEEGLDKDDVESLMQEFAFDEEVDDEASIKKAKLAKKKAVSQAKKYFNQQKEVYKKPLESSPAEMPPEKEEKIKAFEEILQKAEAQQQNDAKKREVFVQKTDEVFGSGFKGFEFTIEDAERGTKKYTFSPADAAELKKLQATPINFINKFLDENGFMKDAAGYHRSLAIAMNPDRFAKFFYDQGVAEATESILRKQKNINMSERRVPEVITKGGTTIRSLSSDSGHGLKIKSKKT